MSTAAAEVLAIEPGIRKDMPADTYHAQPGASQSRLKKLRDKSAAHVRWEMDNPTPPTPAQVVGAAAHDAVLLPDVFEELWVRNVEGDGRTKAVREAREQLQAEHPDATVLSPPDYDTCIAIRDAIAGHRYARQLLVGDAEQSAWWEDEATGVLCKGRFDLVGLRTGTIVDLKTTTDASSEEFTRTIYRYGYYLQAAHYVNGAKRLGLDVEHFAIIAVEKQPPWAVAIYRVKDDALFAGGEELEPLLERWAECERTGEWPSYPVEVQDITLPPWSWRQIDERLGRV